MTHRAFRKVFSNTAWMAASRLAVALVKFVTVPLVLGTYGRASYGLIALATGLNAYLQVLALGLPSGVVRHVAMALGRGDRAEVAGIARSSLSLYLGLGVLNALALGVVATWGEGLFNLAPGQWAILQDLVIITTFCALLSWPASLASQWLTAAEEIAWDSGLLLAQALLELVLVVWVSRTAHPPSLPVFFAAQMGLMFLPLPWRLWRWRRYCPLAASLCPGWNTTVFRPVLTYSAGLILMHLARVSAMELRPVILGMRAPDGALAASDFRVLFGITQLVLMASSWFSAPLLPAVARATSRSDARFLARVTYDLTRWVWGVLALPLWIGIACAAPLLRLYVGESLVALAPWLRVWLAALASVLYLGPLSAVVLADGRVRALVVSSLVACAAALGVGWWLTPRLGLGGVMLGTVVYYGIQMVFYHVYFIPRILKADTGRLLRTALLPPVIAGLFALPAGFFAVRWAGRAAPLAQVGAGGLAVALVYLPIALRWFVKPSDLRRLWSVLRASDPEPAHV